MAGCHEGIRDRLREVAGGTRLRQHSGDRLVDAPMARGVGRSGLRGTALVPTAASNPSRTSTAGDDGDAGDAPGRIYTDRLPAGGRAVAGSNPVAPISIQMAYRSATGVDHRPPRDLAVQVPPYAAAARRRCLKPGYFAVLVPLPVSRCAFQQLQPWHAGDYRIRVDDRVNEPIRRQCLAGFEAGNGRCTRSGALSDLPWAPRHGPERRGAPGLRSGADDRTRVQLTPPYMGCKSARYRRASKAPTPERLGRLGRKMGPSRLRWPRLPRAVGRLTWGENRADTVVRWRSASSARPPRARDAGGPADEVADAPPRGGRVSKKGASGSRAVARAVPAAVVLLAFATPASARIRVLDVGYRTPGCLAHTRAPGRSTRAPDESHPEGVTDLDARLRSRHPEVVFDLATNDRGQVPIFRANLAAVWERIGEHRDLTLVTSFCWVTRAALSL